MLSDCVCLCVRARACAQNCPFDVCVARFENLQAATPGVINIYANTTTAQKKSICFFII